MGCLVVREALKKLLLDLQSIRTSPGLDDHLLHMHNLKGSNFGNQIRNMIPFLKSSLWTCILNLNHVVWTQKDLEIPYETRLREKELGHENFHQDDPHVLLESTTS